MPTPLRRILFQMLVMCFGRPVTSASMPPSRSSRESVAITSSM